MYEIRTLTSADFETDVIIFGHGAKPFVMLPGLSIRPITEYAETISGAYDMFSRDYTVYVFDIKKNIPECYSIAHVYEPAEKVINGRITACRL